MAADSKAVWLDRVLDYQLPTKSAAGPTSPAATAANGRSGDAMAGWQAARTTALASLKALEGAFRGMKHPSSDRAVILLRAIQANLTASPATPAQVKELETYLIGDRIITEAEMPNGFGFNVALRGPLLAALADLKGEQAAAGGRA